MNLRPELLPPPVSRRRQDETAREIHSREASPEENVDEALAYRGIAL
ncbi:hypothetical protein [Streptomyces nondiastaticus]|uniref:Uncharacterized protein n=1 Tax=Streptomyces nondiastaticus TaxID=3154512 RepID=A0ABW6U0B0_9ACTN